MLFLFSLFLGLILGDPVLQENRFTTSYPVWTASWLSTPSHNRPNCELLNIGETSYRLVHHTGSSVLKTKPSTREIEPLNDGHHNHHHDHSHDDENPHVEHITTVYALTKKEIFEMISTLCFNYSMPPTPEITKQDRADTVTQIVSNGPPSNRIDVVFMGDGYTLSQESAMDSDMKRLTQDMFEDVTFAAYLPVFNIWSVFRASQESGIGAGGTPKKTSFGLYRDGTELRGVYCSKPAQARQACLETGKDACDFPSLIGNDPYYGGLGGEFTISTESKTSGTLVLRHELGHNFIQVGEEYDGGSAYFGVNHSPISRGLDVRWKIWATEPHNLQFEGADLRVQSYAWYDLGKGPFKIPFTSDGTNSRWLIRFSISGCETQNSFSVTLDGVPLPWKTRGTLDRCIEEHFSNVPLARGDHLLVFTQSIPPVKGNPIRQLCSVTLHEYKPEPKFHISNDFIGLYPTWKQNKVLAGYRPMNEYCLMRNMSSTAFCPVCYEGMWMQFFAAISVIDDVHVKCGGSENATIQLNTVKLGQLRKGGAMHGERLHVKWFHAGTHIPALDDDFSFTVSSVIYSGQWEAKVNYVTPLVRDDPKKLLDFSQKFTVSRC